MRLAALFSGGKDSTHAINIMGMQGHEVSDLVSVIPKDRHSWIFHTPNLHLLPQMAELMGMRLTTAASSGTEVDDLRALRRALSGLEVDGVVTGALASDYQWDRINGVCEDLGLPAYSPLWRKDQSLLMRDMVDSGIRAMMVTVSAEGLGPSWLGRTIDHKAIEELSLLSERYGINMSGEGGEYETLVTDSPLHSKPLIPLESEIEISRDGGRLTVTRVRKGEGNGPE